MPGREQERMELWLAWLLMVRTTVIFMKLAGGSRLVYIAT
jgi:hypothetical protein